MLILCVSPKFQPVHVKVREMCIGQYLDTDLTKKPSQNKAKGFWSCFAIKSFGIQFLLCTCKYWYSESTKRNLRM